MKKILKILSGFAVMITAVFLMVSSYSQPSRAANIPTDNGVNYKATSTNMVADAAYFKSVGINTIRPNLAELICPWNQSWTEAPGNGTYAYWRQVAVYFKSQGFFVNWGPSGACNLLAGTMSSTAWTLYHDSVVAEATYMQSQGIALDVFELGNEKDNRPDGTTLTRQQFVANMGQLATDVKAVYPLASKIGYSLWDDSGLAYNDWIAVGKGGVDILMVHPYGNMQNNGHGISFGGYASLAKMVKRFGTSSIWVSEYGLEATDANLLMFPDFLRKSAMRNFLALMSNLGINRREVYTYVGYLNTDNQFAMKYLNGTYAPEWDVILRNGGRTQSLTTGASIGSSRFATNLTSTPALYFGNTSGQTGVVTITNTTSLKNLSAVTIEAWVRLNEKPSGYNARVISYGDVTSKGFDFYIPSGTNNITGSVGNSTSWADSGGNGILSLGQWHHVATTWDGTTVRSFIDGQHVVTDAALAGGNTGDPAKNLTIGNFSTGARAFPGLIQEVRVSNVARYVATFATPTQQRFINDANTVALWHMDEGTGTNIADSGSNGLTGTVSGSPLPLWSLGAIKVASNTVRKTASNRHTISGVTSTNVYFKGDLIGNYVTPIDTTTLQIGMTSDYSVGVKAYFIKKENANNADPFALVTNDFNFGSNQGYSFEVRGNDGKPQVVAGNTFYTAVTSSLVSYNQWTWVIYTLSGTTMKCYVDGALVWTQTIVRRANASSTVSQILIENIGPGSSARAFFGNVQRFFSTHTALDQTAINNIVQNDTYPAVDILYKFDEGISTILKDYSGNNNVGQINKVPDWIKSGRTTL